MCRSFTERSPLTTDVNCTSFMFILYFGQWSPICFQGLQTQDCTYHSQDIQKSAFLEQTRLCGGLRIPQGCHCEDRMRREGLYVCRYVFVDPIPTSSLQPEHVYVCVCVCVCARARARAYVCEFVCVHTYTHTHTYIYFAFQGHTCADGGPGLGIELELQLQPQLMAMADP